MLMLGIVFFCLGAGGGNRSAVVRRGAFDAGCTESDILASDLGPLAKVHFWDSRNARTLAVIGALRH
jgi:hypothetical protein